MTTSRELVSRSINFQPVEKVPVMYGLPAAIFLKYKGKIVDLVEKYPDDFGYKAHVPQTKDLRPLAKKGEYRDEWNCLWEILENGYTGQCTQHPLADWNALDSYEFPPLPAKDGLRIKKKKEYVKEAKKKWFVGESPYGGSGPFDRLQNLRGYENLMIDLLEESTRLDFLADRLFAYTLEGVELMLECKPDFIKFYDDWGTQKNLIISPDLWRRIFKPRYKKLFDRVHHAGPRVFFHSCGRIIDIIPDFIEIGVDILNPQVSCMDLDKLTQITSGNICIACDIDQQYVLPSGTPAEVKIHTRKILDKFEAREGGFIALVRAKTDTPLENIQAMLEEIWNY